MRDGLHYFEVGPFLGFDLDLNRFGRLEDSRQCDINSKRPLFHGFGGHCRGRFLGVISKCRKACNEARGENRRRPSGYVVHQHFVVLR